MKNGTKALKTLNYILASFVFVLFFLFLLTYDFTPRSAYSYKGDVKIREDLEADIKEMSSENFLSADISGEKMTQVLYNLIKNNDDIDLFKSSIWTIKGLSVDIVRGRIALSIYSSYHDKFRYNIRIKAYLKLEETTEGFVFSVDSISFGMLFVPKKYIRKVLSSSNEGSIGTIFKETLKIIPFGTYDPLELSYSISINDVLESLENRTFLGNLNDLHPGLNYLLMTYILESYNEGIFGLELTDRLTITFDYSRLVNAKTNPIISDSYIAKSETLSICFKHFLMLDEIGLTDRELSSLTMLKFKDFNGNDAINIVDTNMKIYDDTIHLKIALEVFGKSSLMDLFFIKNLDSYYLNRIEIGRDDKEKENNYFVIESQESLTYMMKFLKLYGFKMTSFTRKLDELSLINGSYLKFDEISLDDSGVIGTLKSDYIYRNAIYYTIVSSEFRSSLGEIDHLLDYSTDEALIRSFSRLSAENKENYFKKIKSYTKDESSLYNYIIDFLGED